jgi:hypothetical protein
VKGVEIVQQSTPQRNQNTKLLALVVLAIAIGGFMLWSTGQRRASPASVPASEGTNRTITRAELGDKWPFTVDKGSVMCLEGRYVVFIADGKTYALNGTAVSSGRFQDIAPIRRPDPLDSRYPVSTQPILDVGLPLCK